jgi:hypothetical protein
MDRLTLVAIAVVAYALANIAHEGVGHGGACVVAGGRPVALSAVYFDCDEAGLGRAAVKGISAAGTLVNLALGGLAFAALRSRRRAATPGRYFLWLLMSVNLLQGAGYWLFSGLGNVGDWAAVIEGLTPHLVARAILAIAGGAAYCGAIRLSLGELLPFAGPGPDRRAHARLLCRVPYLAGGVLYVLAGALNPLGWRLVVISAAAASFGGTSALAWMTELLRNERRFPPPTEPPLSLPRSGGWLTAAVVAVLVFVGVLGPAVRF